MFGRLMTRLQRFGVYEIAFQDCDVGRGGCKLSELGSRGKVADDGKDLVGLVFTLNSEKWGVLGKIHH